MLLFILIVISFISLGEGVRALITCRSDSLSCSYVHFSFISSVIRSFLRLFVHTLVNHSSNHCHSCPCSFSLLLILSRSFGGVRALITCRSDSLSCSYVHFSFIALVICSFLRLFVHALVNHSSNHCHSCLCSFSLLLILSRSF
jgi:hypothetical protein